MIRHFTPLGWRCRGEIVIDPPRRTRCVLCGRTGDVHLFPTDPAPVLAHPARKTAA